MWRATRWVRQRRWVPWRSSDAMPVCVFCRGLLLGLNELSGGIPSTLGNLALLGSVWRGSRVCVCVWGAQSSVVCGACGACVLMCSDARELRCDWNDMPERPR
jgi:hypothetical protein